MHFIYEELFSFFFTKVRCTTGFSYANAISSNWGLLEQTDERIFMIPLA